jgi:hypothetical protein
MRKAIKESGREIWTARSRPDHYRPGRSVHSRRSYLRVQAGGQVRLPAEESGGAGRTTQANPEGNVRSRPRKPPDSSAPASTTAGGIVFVREAAIQARVSEQTAHRRWSEPSFRLKVNEAWSDVVRQAVGKLGDASIQAAVNACTFIQS